MAEKWGDYEVVKKLIEKEKIVCNWKKHEIVENMKNIWDNTYCLIEDDIVKMEDGLVMESKFWAD